MAEDLYAILGLPRTATPDMIKQSWKEARLKHHPDKGGDEEMFKKARAAYEVLSDPDKKELYDRTGSTEEEGPGMPPDIASIFAAMAGGGGMPFGFGIPTRPGRNAPKGQNKEYEFKVTLEEFYKGKTVPVTFNQNKFCTTCKGSGGSSSEECKRCGGRGRVMETRQMGPGMIMQGVTECQPCSGTGKKVTGTCGSCKGRKFAEKTKTLNVVIKPGMGEEEIVFREECSDTTDADRPGDVVICLKQVPHDLYKRGGPAQADLFVERVVELQDALLGFRIELPHPRGEPVVVESTGPVQYGSVIVLSGAGMPCRDAPGCGDLHVTIKIKMPDTLTDAQRALLRGCFAPMGPQLA